MKLTRAFKTIRKRISAPLHIEFNLTDHCNLNCKGCSHYSPLAPAEFEALDEVEAEMKHISSIRNVSLIKEVYLIGGETLLYPRLKDAMRLARRYFPSVKISIFTNGLLLPKMDEEFWHLCSELKIVIAITRYPVKFDYDAVEQLCKEKGVETEVFGDRGEDDSFFKLPLDPMKKQNGWISHFKCFSFGCITIDHGKVFPCSQAACVGHLNRKCGTDFRWEPGDYIPVEELTDARQLLKLRNRPIPFCKYCRKPEVTAYGPSRRTASEWT